LDESALLNVVPAADAFAGLRIIENSILAVDVMFDIEIVGVRSIPVALQRQPPVRSFIPSPTYASGCYFGTWGVLASAGCNERKGISIRL
jgi:hypothetical protein